MMPFAATSRHARQEVDQEEAETHGERLERIARLAAAVNAGGRRRLGGGSGWARAAAADGAVLGSHMRMGERERLAAGMRQWRGCGR